MPPMKASAKKAPGKPSAPKKPTSRSKTGNSACSQAASNWQLAIRGKAPLDPDTYKTLGKCRAMSRAAKSADGRAAAGYNLSEQGRDAIKGRLQKRFDQGLITQKSRQDRLKTLLAQRKEKQAAATQAKAKSADPKKELSKEDYLALAMSRDLSEKRFGENKKAVASQAGFPNHPENDPKLQAMTAQQRIEYRNGKEYQDAVNDWHNKASKTQEEWGKKAVGARVISRLGSISKVSGLTQTNGGTSATLRDGTVLKVTNFGSTAQWGGYQIMPPRGSSERKSIIQKRWDERKHPASAPAPAPAAKQYSPVSRPSVDHSFLSPSGRVSKRSKERAIKKTSETLFGPGGMPHPQLPKPPTEQEYLRRQAAELRDMASRGLKPRAYKKKADELEAKANSLDSPSAPAPAPAKFSRGGQLAPGRGTEERKNQSEYMIALRSGNQERIAVAKTKISERDSDRIHHSYKQFLKFRDNTPRISVGREAGNNGYMPNQKKKIVYK